MIPGLWQVFVGITIGQIVYTSHQQKVESTEEQRLNGLFEGAGGNGRSTN